MASNLKKLTALCEKYTSGFSELLYELERETHLKTLNPQMLSGHLQGRFLSLLSRLLQPKAILEIGTFTGYAAICLAEGLAEGGVLHTIEVNPELEYISRKYFRKAGLENRIQQHTGNAFDIIPTLKEQFDIVFIDAGKRDNAAYFDLVIERLRPGGFILVDNVLWSGKIGLKARDADTRSIRNFLEKVRSDERVETMLLPVRDGLLLAEKKPLQQRG
ncbi:MAG: methyltransferase [Saprospirales bacterium]|nr:methyltransferase [Saprospirales bacterium]